MGRVGWSGVEWTLEDRDVETKSTCMSRNGTGEMFIVVRSVEPRDV